METPETPEALFAAYRALRDDSGTTAEAYETLMKRTRLARAAWKKAGEREAATQLALLQDYIRQAKPVDPATLFRVEEFERELAQLCAQRRDGGSRDDLERGVRSLWRRLVEVRSVYARDPAYDSDHDEFVDGEERLGDLARDLGIDLNVD